MLCRSGLFVWNASYDDLLKMSAFIKLVLLSICITQMTMVDQHDIVIDVYDMEDYYDGHENDNHMCHEIQEYEDHVTKPVNITELKEVRELCYRFLPFKCTKLVNVTKEYNRTFSVLKTRTVYKCCKGYEKVNDTCVATCPWGCKHGNCTKPNHCHCEAGWQGASCSKECDVGWYGQDCDLLCSCFNGATCDRFNGKCSCALDQIATFIKGFAGRYCEIDCKTAFDKKCTQPAKCTCKNGAKNCSRIECECFPGYHGPNCDIECEAGKFGVDCASNCTCSKERTELCNPVDGKCQCLPGWRDKCEKPCELGRWGRHCESKCNCGPNGTCHHVSGVCSCQPGLHGVNCEEKCPIGYFEKDCKMKCPKCLHEPGTCHHETGWCICPTGKFERFCHLECPFGKFGANCSEYCLCNHNSTCDSVTGECSCTPGWGGPFCSTPCPEGTYGVNCSLSCNCSICDNEDGTCLEVLPEGMVQINSLYEELPYPPTYVNCILGFFAFILIVIILVAMTWKLSKIPYFSNIYQSLRKRIQEIDFFKSSELRKEDSSTSNVFQEETPTINPSGQYTNPLYYAAEGMNSEGRPTSTVHPIFAPNEENHNVLVGDNFENVEFKIPEAELAMGSPAEKPEIRISFGKDAMETKGPMNSSPVINYSNPGKRETYFFPGPEKNYTETSENKEVVDEHRYENVPENATVSTSTG